MHCPRQTFDFDWREHGLRFVPPPPLPNPNISKTIPNIQFNEFDGIIIIDGSFQGIRQAEHYRSGGAAFIIHVFETKSTYFGGKHLNQSQTDNSAPVSEAEATLLAFKSANTLKLKNPLCIHDNQDMTNFLIGKSSSSRHGNRYAQLKDQIKHAASKFNTISCSHIYSHERHGIHLDENKAVDLLAIFFRKNINLSIDICRLDTDINDKLRRIFPNATDFPFIACPLMSSGIKCAKCGSPLACSEIFLFMT
jgi:ribonuclease HI